MDPFGRFYPDLLKLDFQVSLGICFSGGTEYENLLWFVQATGVYGTKAVLSVSLHRILIKTNTAILCLNK